MKQVSKSSKGKGKEVAREVDINAGLPNGYADLASPTPGVDDDADSKHRRQEGQEDQSQEHDRDGTMASYRTAQEEDEEEDTEESEGSGDNDDDETEEDGDTPSEVASKHEHPKRIGQSSHDRSKRPRAVQDIFQNESLIKVSYIDQKDFEIKI